MSIIPVYERLAKQSTINPSPELIALKDAVDRIRELEAKNDAATLAAYELGLAEGVEQGIERVKACRPVGGYPESVVVQACQDALEAWRDELGGKS